MATKKNSEKTFLVLNDLKKIQYLQMENQILESKARKMTGASEESIKRNERNKNKW